jgi:hypothetical protein
MRFDATPVAEGDQETKGDRSSVVDSRDRVEVGALSKVKIVKVVKNVIFLHVILLAASPIRPCPLVV